MTLEFIKNQLSKEYVFSKETLNHWMDKINSYPHNEWFTPTNKEGDNYDYCADLYYLNLCEVQKTPVWKNGSFVGTKIQFKITIEK